MYATRPNQRLKLRDDLPRFINFSYGLYNPRDNTVAPPCLPLMLPYQILPSGRILCSQLLKLEYSFSMVGNGSTANTNSGYFDRCVIDCMTQPTTNAGIALAWNTVADGNEVAANPWARASVVAVLDRAIVNTGVVAGTTTTVYEKLSDEKDFGVCGEYPVIPTGSLYIWGFTLAANGANQDGQTLPNNAANPFVAPYLGVLRPTIGLVPPGGTEVPGDIATRVIGRLWYRTVELEPYQHLMIVSKFKTASSNNQITNMYDKTANISVNPNTAGNATNVWFGS